MPPVDRLFDARHVFDSPFTLGVVVGVGGLLMLAVGVIAAGRRLGWFTDALHADLSRRTRAWLWLAPLMGAPILAGGFWTILGCGALALLCLREWARATGLFRERAVCCVLAGLTALVFFAVVDCWYAFFLALPALGTAALVVVGLWGDRPAGYIQRTSLAIFAFLFIGMGLGHFAWFTNDAGYRPLLLLLLLAVELNDVFAYCCGKALGRRRLCPVTSPNKTFEGACGALLLTTGLVAVLGRMVFAGTGMDNPWLLLGLGAVVASAGQLGDLVLSAVKRDIGLKDMGTVIPGHGGLLDRFDSLLLVAPVAFHYLRYFSGIHDAGPQRLLSHFWSVH